MSIKLFYKFKIKHTSTVVYFYGAFESFISLKALFPVVYFM